MICLFKMTKPKDVIILYLTLALIAGVFYHTVFKHKRDGNIQNKELVNKRRNLNTCSKLGD